MLHDKIKNYYFPKEVAEHGYMPHKNKNILVCGGAGYIGSHMVQMLLENGFTPIIFDDFSTGNREAVGGVTIVEGSLTTPADIQKVFTTYSVYAVMHFAAKSLVGESVTDPYEYFYTNVAGTLNLLKAMKDAHVSRIVFSSTAAVYGQPSSSAPITEDTPLAPTNPYGTSKKQIEEMLHAAFTAYNLCSVSLRYFNAAGAHPSGTIGEAHRPETHLIPNALKALLETGTNLMLFGDDYDTPDGTCVRDYIHILDLCKAHLLALQFLASNEGAFAFNLGNGKGFSVKEVLGAIKEVTGLTVPHTVMPRRQGDPATLVADSGNARILLGWQPDHPTIQEIIETAWRWHSNPVF